MSQEKVFEFLVALDDDPALRDAFASAISGQDSHASAAVGFADRHGFTFTEGDFHAAVEQAASGQPEELGEDELDAVAGGTRRAFSPQRAGRGYRNLGMKFGSEKGIIIVNS